MNVSDMVKSIMNGDVDGDFDKIFDAVKARRSIVTRIRVMTSDIKKGDRVRLVNIRPQYIIGATGTVTTIRQTRAVVKLDTSFPRFGSSPSVPINCLEKVTTA
jgi:hypothetical protein